MKVQIEESWQQRLQDEFDKPYFEKLVAFVKSEYKKAHVLPPGHQIFHVFNACPFEKVKIVILGQDPYPNPGQYYGVCFSVPDGVAIPGSLANIFKEIHMDLGTPILRESGPLGSPGGIPHKLGTHGSGVRNGISQRQRLGNFYRCRDQKIK